MIGVYRHRHRTTPNRRTLPCRLRGGPAVFAIGTGGDYPTISAAMAAVRAIPGDIFRLVSNIVDNVTWSANNCGTPEHPVELDGDGYSLDASGGNVGVLINGLSGIKIYDMPINNPVTSGIYGQTCGNADISYIWIDNCPVSGAGTMGIQFYSRSNVTDRYQSVHHVYVDGCDISNAGQNGISFAGYWDLHDNFVTGCNVTGANQDQGEYQGISFITIGVNPTTWTNVSGTIYYTALPAGYLNTDIYKAWNQTENTLLTPNPGNYATLGANEWDAAQVGGEERLYVNIGETLPGDTIRYSFGKNSDFVISGNTVSGTLTDSVDGSDGCGIFTDWGCEDGEAYQNHIHGNYGYGMRTKAARNIHWWSNLCHGNGLTTGGTDIEAYVSDSSENIDFSRCTVDADGSEYGIGYAHGSSGDIRGCIIMDAATHGIINAGTGVVTEDYNDFYGNTADRSGVDVGEHSISSNPLFETGTYVLSSGSPCKDTGIAVSGVNVDLLGISIPVGGGPDIGCYEYSIVVQYGALSDSLYMSELTTQLAHYGAALSDLLDMGEGQMPLGNFLSNLGDALGLSELITQTGHYRGANGDTVIFSDGITATVHYTGSLTDTLTISDSAEALLSAIAAIADIMSFADLTAYVSDNIGALSDILSFSENRTALRSLIAGNIDAITFAELTVGRGNYTASRADIVSLADIVSGRLRLRAALIDSLTLSDELTIQAIGTLIDNILFSEARFGTIHFAVSLSDTLSLADQMSALGRYAARLSDLIGVNDQLSYVFTPVTPEGPVLSFTSRGITFEFSSKTQTFNFIAN